MTMSLPVCIIAEAGVNHNGDPDLAFHLIDSAAKAGADIIKFQTFTADNIIVASAPKAAYQLRTTDGCESQLDMLRRLQLPYTLYPRLAAYAKEKGLGFLSSPFDEAAVALLAEMGLDTVKIPSGEITNLPYLRKIAAQKWNVILSTGMSTMSEVGEALYALEMAGKAPEQITLLHCTTEYPAPFTDVNLRAMFTLRDAFPRCAGVGYSDHTVGVEIALAATALGATCIEKHFTLDRTLQGPDHKASLEPSELASLVRAVRHVSQSLGNGEKKPCHRELANRSIIRKSIVAARDIAVGETLTEANLTVKRPANGITPMAWDQILGCSALRTLRRDEPVHRDKISGIS